MDINPGDKVLIRQCPCMLCSTDGCLPIAKYCLPDKVGSVGIVLISVDPYRLLDIGDHVMWLNVALLVKIDGD